ncbi:MAG: twin-arginine translocase subunit TatC [Rhodospirillaceae bacterium]|nr:twin-arginine translocase subunit TatC [Rhodospirillaceae bacterium]
MPLVDHLIELRNRLVYAVGAMFVAFLICYIFASDIFDFLVAPLAQELRDAGQAELAVSLETATEAGDSSGAVIQLETPAEPVDQAGPTLVYTSLPEVFFSYVKVAFFAGAFIAFPIIATQLYLFIAPGLYRREKHAFLPYLVAAPILFFLGGAMVYYAIFPLAWKFFLSFQTTGENGGVSIEVLPRVGDYLNLVMKMIFAFGLAFQLPIALTLMARAGIVSADALRRKRKFAIVGVFVVAAILTPPDIISQVGLAVPILALYEASIFLARMIEKRRAEREAAEETG